MGNRLRESEIAWHGLTGGGCSEELTSQLRKLHLVRLEVDGLVMRIGKGSPPLQYAPLWTFMWWIAWGSRTGAIASLPPEQSPQAISQQAESGEIAMARDAEEQGIQPEGGGTSSKRNLVAGVLGPALKLWLRSQVEAATRLDVRIGSEMGEGGSLSSRQMLAGRIPRVQVEADGVIYKGLHLGQLKLVGRDIRMNLGQAVRGKPLKLLAPIVVDLELRMSEAQLNESLESPLLAPQLGEWLELLQELLLEEEKLGELQLSQPQIALSGGALGGTKLEAERLGLQAQYGPAVQADSRADARADSQADAAAGEIAIETALTVRNGNVLKLRQPRWSEAPPAGFQDDLSSLAMMPLKLGSDVAIEQIAIAAGQLHLVGQLTVQP